MNAQPRNLLLECTTSQCTLHSTQPSQVLAGAARLVGIAMHKNRRAGAAIVARLTDRIQQAAVAASRAGRDAVAAALAAQEADAYLHFAVLLASSDGGGALQAALLLRLPQLLPLGRSPSSSTRRLLLDVCSALLPSVARLPFSPAAAVPQCAAVQAAEAAGADPAAAAAAGLVAQPTPPPHPTQAYRSALLAAVVSRMEDKDATLRAKALSCLEKHASMAAAHLNAATAAHDVGSVSSDALLQALCGRWACSETACASSDVVLLRVKCLSSQTHSCSQPAAASHSCRLHDKSPSVRKKAVAVLAALLQPAAGLSRPAAAALADAVLPLAAQLLGVRPDSALHLGEDTLKASLRLSSCWSAAGRSRWVLNPASEALAMRRHMAIPRTNGHQSLSLHYA